jgi:hypothetical protein
MMWIGAQIRLKSRNKIVSKSIRAAENFNDLSAVFNLIAQRCDLDKKLDLIGFLRKCTAMVQTTKCPFLDLNQQKGKKQLH